MTLAPRDGSPSNQPVSGRMRPTSRQALDRALSQLADRRWSALALAERRLLLARLGGTVARISPAWVEASLEAKGISPTDPAAGEEWLAGPYLILRNLRLLDSALEQIGRSGRPLIPGPIRVRRGGQVAARVFPGDLYDRILYPPGTAAEVWMEPEVSAESLASTQALAYGPGRPDGGVALILGAGNVSSIGPMDVLYKLFVDNRAVIYKTHPVNDYLGPLLEEAFQPLAEAGAFRVVYGGSEEGDYLCRHPRVDEIHITGSDKTVEAIVFGSGEEGERRKRERRPRLTKPITCELGNVSPVIVVPGRWSRSDLAFHAESLVSTLANNAGFNCNATRVLVQHASWDQRQDLLAAIRRLFAALPTRAAYYPGAGERLERFTAAHPRRVERFGPDSSGRLPWTLIPDLDPGRPEEICFTTEAFTSLFAETAIDGSSIPAYLERTVDFVNERLWGTLNAAILVHPHSLRDAEVRAAVGRAVAELRYGTVALNQWPALSYGLVVTPWGAFPGHDVYDVQSGIGVVHNTLMFSRPQKTVVRVPFRLFPKPPWFVTHRNGRSVADLLTRFEMSPGLGRIPRIVWAAVRA